MKHDIRDVIDIMQKYGGGFIKAMATCWLRADIYNQAILEKAFEKYFFEYDRMLQIEEKKENVSKR